MHWFAIAVLSALAFGLAGFFMKASQMRGGALSSLLIGLYAYGTAGFWIQALLTRSWQPFDWRIWTAGAIIGLGSAWGNLLFMRALARGPASLVSPLTNANIVIVMAAGIVWFGETPHATGLVGACWLLVGIALLSLRGSLRGGDHGTTISRASPAQRAARLGSWYPLALAAMGLFVLRNGGLKVTDRIGLDSANVLWAGYLLSLLWFLAAAGRSKHAGHQNGGGGRTSEAQPSADVKTRSSAARIGFGWGLAAGAFSYGGLQLYAVALARGPAHLVAPIFAANSLVVVVLSLAVYRERLSFPQYAALICLLGGLVLIRI
ncbi:EamA family transporter [Cohnella hashimotonis]|uniref:EamA family transporter n=1 Tax=Cohnella hashimotonis TaxID=2826895 RepID=A0ABT6TDE9_9BACL|nr:EamA family transporter [Cohnella hashimotonis]MDI4644365.1 EamA family transporter [Cohnella hashimotonis]